MKASDRRPLAVYRAGVRCACCVAIFAVSLLLPWLEGVLHLPSAMLMTCICTVAWTLEGACEPLLAERTTSRFGTWCLTVVAFGVLWLGGVFGYVQARYILALLDGATFEQAFAAPLRPMSMRVRLALPWDGNLALCFAVFATLYPRLRPRDAFRASLIHALSVLLAVVAPVTFGAALYRGDAWWYGLGIPVLAAGVFGGLSLLLAVPDTWEPDALDRWNGP